MMDLHRRMERLGGTIGSPTTTDIEGDLARGRRAVRRRRIAGGSAFGAAALAGVLALTTVTGPTSGTAPVPILAEESAAVAGLQLVAYSGEQPRGFTIDRVPQGFTVQTQGEHALVLAPDQLPSVRVSGVPDSVLDDPQAFIYKIAVYLASPENVPPDSETITVDGRDARRHLDLPGESGSARQPGARYYITVAPSVYLAVQFWPDMTLTEEQRIEIVSGIDVTPEAVAAYKG